MIKKGYYYTREHEWVNVTEAGLYVGITDYAQKQLGDIVYVELPEVGKAYDGQEAVAVIESVKTASDVYMPVNGTIIEINPELEENPERINQDCYGQFLFVVKPEGDRYLDDLLNSEEYEKYLEGRIV